jgi:hypothetical protein
VFAAGPVAAGPVAAHTAQVALRDKTATRAAGDRRRNAVLNPAVKPVLNIVPRSPGKNSRARGAECGMAAWT